MRARGRRPCMGLRGTFANMKTDPADDVDLPAALREVPLAIPLRILRAERHPNDEIALVYELDVETLPMFGIEATRVRGEVRLQAPAGALEDPAWVATARENIAFAIRGDVREALALFLGVSRGQLEVRPKLNVDEGVRRLLEEANRAIEPVLWPLRIAAAVVWMRERALSILLVIAVVFVAVWLLVGR